MIEFKRKHGMNIIFNHVRGRHHTIIINYYMMRKLILFTITILGTVLSLTAQPRAAKTEIIPLWPDGAPNSSGITAAEVNNNETYMNVTEASMRVFRPQVPNGVCIIVCPGGAYVVEAANVEGSDMAGWLNSLGVTLCVLKYRLPNGHYEVPISDAEQAVRKVREHAAEWKINKVGIMGFSAGGHLASTLATHYSSPETRPDFQVLIYPVITMDPQYTHELSMRSLLGENPSKEMLDLFSNEKHVTADTPQAFIALSHDDSAVAPLNSILYYTELLKNKVSATMHIYPSGGHGWGFRDTFPYKRQWTEEFETWLRNVILIK
jgi:acetyl esterase/lipase